MRDVAKLSGGSYAALARRLAYAGSLGALLPWETAGAGDRPKRPMPDGCEWFRSCGRCNFGDCAACGNGSMDYLAPGTVMRYGAPSADRLRAGAFKTALADGMGFYEAREFFDVDTETAMRYARDGRSKQRGQSRAVQEEAIKARKAGVPELVVAGRCGVHPRTVRNWCRGVDGIERGNGTKTRHMLASVCTDRNMS